MVGLAKHMQRPMLGLCRFDLLGCWVLGGLIIHYTGIHSPRVYLLAYK
jgi:hypothetical protein